MKRILSLLLIALLAFCALTGCMNGKTNPEASSEPTAEPEDTTQPTDEPEVTAEPTAEPEITPAPTEREGALTFGPIEGASSEPAAEGEWDESYPIPFNETEVRTFEFIRPFKASNVYSFSCGEVGPAEAADGGSRVTISIVNYETSELLESRPLVDAADIAYLSKHVAEAEYRPVTENEEEFAAAPNVLITLSVYNSDGTEDHFRFTANSYIAHSTEPFPVTADFDKAEHVSLEPVEAVVRMHVAALAAHNMYTHISDAGDPFKRIELRDENTSELVIKFEPPTGGEIFIEGEEAIAFGELIPNTDFAGTLMGAGYSIPEDAVRISAIIKDVQHWDDLIWTEFYITPEGRIFHPIRTVDGYTFRDSPDHKNLTIVAGFVIEYDRLFPEAAEYAFGLKPTDT